MEIALTALKWLGLVVGLIVALFVARRLLDKTEVGTHQHRLRNQVLMLLLTAGGFLGLIVFGPLDEGLQQHLLTLFGYLLTAVIALSSTTVLSNAMAGVMMRAVRNFRMGDFIRTGEHFGRVSEHGLFHTEIQTEDRELTTIPNLYLVTHPVTTIRASGTIVSAVVSLGYDIPRTRIEELLLEAARRAELTDPFVHVVELGDFSVTYRIAGMLTEVKKLISTRSALRKRVLDSLHEGGVEIVSPTFMNTRALAAGTVVVPKGARRAAEIQPESAPEDVVFDKAEQAASREGLREVYAKQLEEIEQQQGRVKEAPKGPEREKAEHELSMMNLRKERLEKLIASREAAEE